MRELRGMRVLGEFSNLGVREKENMSLFTTCG